MRFKYIIMDTVNPGQTTILTESGIPTGVVVGFQVIKAATGSVSIARTTTGVIERPPGSGNRVINFIAPAEGDLYLVVTDWTDGVLDETARVRDLQVTSEVQPGTSGLGAIADYVKMLMGGETWKGLAAGVDYGQPFVARAIALIKDRIFTAPPATVDEDALPSRVLYYAGLCAALELIPAARDMWSNMALSITQGDDPAETVTYVNRSKMMDDLRDDLLRKLPAAQAAALPLIDAPVLQLAGDGPDIDEDCDTRVTEDPRSFPTAADFPGSRTFTSDAYGVGLPRRSGVRL